MGGCDFILFWFGVFSFFISQSSEVHMDVCNKFMYHRIFSYCKCLK